MTLQEYIEQKDVHPGPEMAGLAGASFAAVLTILTISNRSPTLLHAVLSLSYGIPMILGWYFIHVDYKSKALLIIMKIISVWTQLCGIGFCIAGLSDCFKEITPVSANRIDFIAKVFVCITVLTNVFKLVSNRI